MKCSFAEQVNMLFIYGEGQQNSTKRPALYIERYSDQMHPSHRIYQRICKKLRETRSLTTRKSKKECVTKTTKSMCL